MLDEDRLAEAGKGDFSRALADECAAGRNKHEDFDKESHCSNMANVSLLM